MIFYAIVCAKQSKKYDKRDRPKLKWQIRISECLKIQIFDVILNHWTASSFKLLSKGFDHILEKYPKKYSQWYLSVALQGSEGT